MHTVSTVFQIKTGATYFCCHCYFFRTSDIVRSMGDCKQESLSLCEDKITLALRLVLLIDNFDSFTYNLVDYVEQCGETCEVVRNTVSLTGLNMDSFSSIILSPGPQTPRRAGCLMEIINQYIRQKPMLGICLGHQAIGEYFGAQLGRAIRPMHGKLSTIQCQEDPLFADIPANMEVVRYHSLILNHMPPSLETIAQTIDGEVMALRHRELAVRGVQFHPEAALTPQGLEIIRNWLIFARGRR